MHFHSFDDLRKFIMIARYSSLSEAADKLHMTKGALSHQIKRLEDGLGFKVFKRHARGIALTARGNEIIETAEPMFRRLELKISELAGISDSKLTIGVTTYFASRWLSPRLMDFMQSHPGIRLRIQPMIDLDNFAGEDVDLAIRWGDGRWSDCEIRKLFDCPAWPAGNRESFEHVQSNGIGKSFAGFTLLRDRVDSNSWSDWYTIAGLSERSGHDTLIIPDPNVRVQAVLDGQGVALNDDLIAEEIRDGKLFRLSPHQLTDYGYFLAYKKRALENPAVEAFILWITSLQESE